VHPPQTLQTEAPIPPSPYIASLAAGDAPTRPTVDTVKYFSDFSHTYYHPRSIIQLNDYSILPSLPPFDTYDAGDELFGSLDREHGLLDRDLRPWAEECDSMQGVQIFSTTNDGWGGFCARYVEKLRDEFGKVGLWVWGIDGASATITSRVREAPPPYQKGLRLRMILGGKPGPPFGERSPCSA
jgi:hypothetical protein